MSQRNSKEGAMVHGQNVQADMHGIMQGHCTRSTVAFRGRALSSPYHRQGQEPNFLWTDREQLLVEWALVSLGIYELQDQASKKQAATHANQKHVLLCHKGKALRFRIGMQLKNKLFQSFLATFDGDPMLDNQDAANEEHQAFPCVHYAIYSCYGVSEACSKTGSIHYSVFVDGMP
ncbi:hypothetical protein EDD15DRAFT_2195898 [Pisolithus albus]|nr:hypothetical protein EDD15DRAFT_2195898 [Pisolithus albus]